MSKRRAGDDSQAQGQGGPAAGESDDEKQSSSQDNANKKQRTEQKTNGAQEEGAATETKETDPNAIQPSPITLCVHDMGPHLKVRDDGLTVVGEKGYRMIRATHGFNEGALYYELQFLPSPPLRISGKLTTPAVRVGFSTAEGDLHAPVGYDIESYALCSPRGTKVHNAHVADFAGEGFGPGDTIGVWMVLPPDPALTSAQALARLQQEKAQQEKEAAEEKSRKKKSKKKQVGGAAAAAVAVAAAAAGADAAEEAAAAALAAATAHQSALSDAEALQNRKFHRHSFLRFYKNGVPLGAPSADLRARGVGTHAYSDKDVVRGMYFPAVSLYMGATVRVNFGPDFTHVPEEVARGVAHVQRQQQQQEEERMQAQQQQGAANEGTGNQSNGASTAASTPNVSSSLLDVGSVAPSSSSPSLSPPVPGAAAGSAASAPAPSPSPSPPAASSSLVPPFRHPLPRSLLTSGLFPHLEGSGSTLQLNPKQVQANTEAADMARQKAILAAFVAAKSAGLQPANAPAGATSAAATEAQPAAVAGKTPKV